MEPEALISAERGSARRTLDGYVAFFPEPVPRRFALPQYELSTVREYDF